MACVTQCLFLSRLEAGDPSLEWRTIESQHFIIHYHRPLEDVARRVASLAERAHDTLVSVMASEPSERTHIILRDTTDGSNGFASVIPRNQITLFVTAPEGFSQLMDHDDWLYGLVAHEYAHIVHLDTIGGLPAVLNRIVGKTWAPNQVQPPWVIEGIATYQEGKRTSGGRTRYTEFAHDLRLASLAERGLSLDQVSSGSRNWPHGTTRYEYGSAFLKYVFDAYGDDKLAVLSRRYGSNPIPWSLNRSVEEATGKPMNALYDEWRDVVRGDAQMSVEAVERAGRREGQQITFIGEANSFPRFVPGTRDVVWRRGDGRSREVYMRVSADTPGASPSPFLKTGRLTKLDPDADGSAVYAQGTTYQGTYSYQDLYWLDGETGRSRQLTNRRRASEPALSADGRQIAFVANGRGQRQLAIMNRDGSDQRVVWSGARFDQAYEPAWSPDGKRIAFSAWRAGGFRDILVVTLATGEVREIGRDRAQDLTPVFGPGGRYLYFVSDRTGIYNVFAVDLSADGNRLWQVTNVVGGAVQPDVSDDGATLVYQGAVAGGYELFTMAIEPESFRPAAPYVNDRTDPVIVRSDEAAVSESRPYSPVRSLAPQFVRGELLINTFGQALSLSTNGEDAIGRHSYTLGAVVGLQDRNLNIATRYSYNRLWPRFTATAARRANRRGGFIIDGVNRRFTEEELSASLSATLPIVRMAEHTGSLTLEWDGRYLRDIENPFVDFDPNEQVPEFPETDAIISGVALRWSISNARAFQHTVGPVTGSTLALNVSLDHPVFGSDFKTLNLGYNVSTYGTLPMSPRTSVSLRLAGGIRLSDRRRTSRFVLGGIPEQDVIDSIINTIRTGSSGYLRGFDRGATSGEHFHLANLELRRELVTIERGLSSLPIYIRRLHVAALLDTGNTWREKVDVTDLRLGLGGALRLDAVFGYFAPGSFDIGYARGFGDGGQNEVWFLLTSSI